MKIQRTLLVSLGLPLALACGEPAPRVESDAGSNVVDSGARDAGSSDSGRPDASARDAGTPDSAVVDTWSTSISSMFTSYCVSCHDTGNPNRDYNLFAEAFRDRDAIRCGVAPLGMRPSGCSGFPPPAQFPIGTGPKPTVDERMRIVSWVEAGAPEQ